MESGDVATQDECKIYDYETSVSEEGKGVSRRVFSKKEMNKERKRMYANSKYDEDDPGIEGTLQRKENRVRTGAKVLVCGEKVGGKNVSAIMSAIGLTTREGRKERVNKSERRRADGIPVDGGAAAVIGFDTFVVYGRFARGV